MEEKSFVRKAMRLRRDTLPAPARILRSQQLMQKIAAFCSARSVRVLHTYLPLGSEPDTTLLVTHALSEKIRVIVPETLPHRQLQHRVLTSLDELAEGRYHTRYPPTGALYEGPLDLIIVPGLAFDAQNYRLGYGGGYYDAFLAAHPEAYKMGVGFDFQQVATIPTESHDAQLDAVWLA